MPDNTIIQQGHFTSNGADKIIPLRSDVDWVKVYNLTNIIGTAQWAGTEWFWQREMPAETWTIVNYHEAASQVISTTIVGSAGLGGGINGVYPRGISLIDSSDKTPGAAVAITDGTAATRPVYATGSTTGLSDRAVVRIYDTDHFTDGMDFTIDTIVLNTSFRLSNTLATAPALVSGAGFWRLIARSTAVYDMFRPRMRVVSNVTAANPCVITTLVDHGLAVGQRVCITVPSEFGMVELNDIEATVTAITTGPPNTFTIGLDSTGFTAFAWPTPALANLTPAQVIPIGVDPVYNTSLDDAQENTAFIGMVLGTSTDAVLASGSPGGANTNVIKWVAGKSFAYDLG